MAKYEVFIPAANAGEFNVTLKVDADNWMAALKTGLTRIGETGTQVVNIMVDIMEDNSIHVTDSVSGRVFRILELAQEAAPSAASSAPQAQQPASPAAASPVPESDRPAVSPVEAPAPVSAVSPAVPAPASEQRPTSQAVSPAVSAPAPVQRPASQAVSPAPSAPAPQQRPTSQPVSPAVSSPATERRPSSPSARPVPTSKDEAPSLRPTAPMSDQSDRAPLPATPAAARPAANPASRTARFEPAPEARPAQPVAQAAASGSEVEPRLRRGPSTEPNRVEQVERPSQPITGRIGRTQSHVAIEDVLSELFERTQEVYGLDRERGLGFLLDLALEKISAEAGSVFVSKLGDPDLALLSVRGPKASDLERMKLRMPMGVGVVGFCAQEAVSLAISDTEKDPRFYREVSDKIGYPASSILCAPMVFAGRSFGCIELINRRGTSCFTDSELALLSYIAHQGARYLESSR